jgi:rapamycin-insensitive companion of mTOR
VDIDRLLQTDAFRIVLSVLKDGPAELGPSVSALLAFLSNFPSTRHRLVPGSDMEVRIIRIHWMVTDHQSALVGFTEDQAKPSSRQPGKQLEKMQATVRNIIILLNTWSGRFGSYSHVSKG